MSLRQRTDVPTILNELVQQDEDVAQLLAQDIADGVGLKITKSGGLTRSRRQRDFCRAAGVTMSVLDPRDIITLQIGTVDAPVQDGGVLPPETPGFGVMVDRAVLGQPLETWES